MAWFRCSHDRTSFPQTIEGKTTVSCLDCGKTMDYDWAGLGTEEEIRPPKMTAPKELAHG